MTGDSDYDSMIGSCIDILKVKGPDYTKGSPDPLHNFKECAKFTGLTPQQVLGVYLHKHISAIYAHINNQTESEPIEGRIADVINYMLLYTKMVRGR